jgi:hypothetical protein
MEQIGVSQATMSAALTHLEAAGAIQRKHGVGIFVSERIHHFSIAIVFDPRYFSFKGVSPYWNLVWDALSKVAQQRAAERGDSFHSYLTPINVEASNAQPLSPDLLAALAAGRIDGVVAVGLTEEAAGVIEQHQVPLVSHAGAGSCQVNTDGLTLMRLATAYLIERHCRTIALWDAGDVIQGSSNGTHGSLGTVHTFISMIQECELRAHVHLIRNGTLKAAFSGLKIPETHQEQGREAVLSIFNEKNLLKPDGIVIQDDMMAQGALTAMARLGIRAGRDVQVVTHSNKGSTVLQGYEDDIVASNTILTKSLPRCSKFSIFFYVAKNPMTGRR